MILEGPRAGRRHLNRTGCWSMGPGAFSLLLTLRCVLAAVDLSCTQDQFLHVNGSCVDCPTCGPGQQLSEDCGYGDGGGGRCEPCGEAEFSTETGLTPCWQCTQCSLLNREERASCTPTSNAECGGCLKGYYELKRKNGVTEPLCMPCLGPSGGLRRDCLPPGPKAGASPINTQPQTGLAPTLSRARPKEDSRTPVSVVVIGSASAASAFFLVLVLWVLLLTAERLNRRFKVSLGWSGMNVESLRSLLPGATSSASPYDTTSAAPGTERQPAQQTDRTDKTPRCPVVAENDAHAPSIVINVTTNIKPAGQCRGGDCEWEEPEETQLSLQEMETKLQEICVMAAGQTLEELDYDTVHDLSLLLDAGGHGGTVQRLGRALEVPAEVLSNVHGFQELFRYLRTSTYTLLPQLAQAVATLHRPDVVDRMHRSLLMRQSGARATRAWETGLR